MQINYETMRDLELRVARLEAIMEQLVKPEEGEEAKEEEKPKKEEDKRVVKPN